MELKGEVIKVDATDGTPRVTVRLYSPPAYGHTDIAGHVEFVTREDVARETYRVGRRCVVTIEPAGT